MKRLLELWIGEGLDLAAVRADEMVVVLPVRLDGLVAGGRRADVHALDEAVASELLEAAVDARDADGAAFGAQAVEDLLGGDAAVLPAEQVDHGPPGGAVPPSHAGQRRGRGVDPVVHPHDRIHTENDYRYTRRPCTRSSRFSPPPRS